MLQQLEQQQQAGQAQTSALMYNPCSTAISCSIGGCIAVIIGAAIRDHSVHDEGITLLTGGAIVGFGIGMILMTLFCIVPPQNALTVSVSAGTLLLGANFLSIYVGLQILDYDIGYTQVLADYFIGVGVLMACMIPCLICVCCLGGAVLLGGAGSGAFGAGSNSV
jgi:hypothetical protein